MNVRKRRGFKSGYSIWLGLFPARVMQGALTDVEIGLYIIFAQRSVLKNTIVLVVLDLVRRMNSGDENK